MKSDKVAASADAIKNEQRRRIIAAGRMTGKPVIASIGFYRLLADMFPERRAQIEKACRAQLELMEFARASNRGYGAELGRMLARFEMNFNLERGKPLPALRKCRVLPAAVQREMERRK
jgi:hypothetical protein